MSKTEAPTKLNQAFKQTAKVLLINGAGEVLLLLDEKDNWDFPGGNRENNDRDIKACARREVLEETGLKIKDSRLRHIGKDAFKGKLRHLFVERVRGRPEVTISDEHKGYKWAKLSNLPVRGMKPKASQLFNYCRKKKSFKPRIKKTRSDSRVNIQPKKREQALAA